MKMINQLVLSPNLQVKLVCINENGSHRIIINFENGDYLVHCVDFSGENELTDEECAVTLGDEVRKFLTGKEWSLFTVQKSKIIGEHMIPVLMKEGEDQVDYSQFIEAPRFSKMSEIEDWALDQDLDEIKKVHVYNKFGFLVEAVKVEE